MLLCGCFLCLCVFFPRPLGPESLLLRGARLKNTKEIFGLYMLKVFNYTFMLILYEVFLKAQHLCSFGWVTCYLVTCCL